MLAVVAAVQGGVVLEALEVLEEVVLVVETQQTARMDYPIQAVVEVVAVAMQMLLHLVVQV